MLDAALLHSQNTDLRAQNSSLKLLVEKLTLELAILRKQLFGASAESTDQLQLFTALTQEIAAAAQPVRLTPAKRPVERTRVVLPPDLPVEREEIDLPEAQKVAADGVPLKRIGEEVSRKLAYEPGSFRIKETVRPKYADPRLPEAGVRIAPLPPALIEGSIADPSLLAHVVVAKYDDQLPLHRLCEIYARGGVALSRSTLGDWVLGVSTWLKPLHERLLVHLRRQRKIHTDETVLPLQAPHKTRKARQWVYLGTDPPIIWYDFTLDKAGEHPRRVLEGWSGYLQADAASNFDALYVDGRIMEVGCWSHARRKYFAIAEAADAQGQRVLAHEAVEKINRLFEVERQASEAGLDAAGRKAVRLERSVPILDDLHAWCTQAVTTLLPKSPTAIAISYTLKHWTALTRFIDDGILSLDNNAAERALRQIALGRNNWLFAGSPAGGEAAAICTSLIETAKANGLEPLRYLTDVLRRLPTTLAKDIDTLLPMSWAPRK